MRFSSCRVQQVQEKQKLLTTCPKAGKSSVGPTTIFKDMINCVFKNLRYQGYWNRHSGSVLRELTGTTETFFSLIFPCNITRMKVLFIPLWVSHKVCLISMSSTRLRLSYSIKVLTSVRGRGRYCHDNDMMITVPRWLVSTSEEREART